MENDQMLIVLKAINDPTRLAILNTILNKGTICACDLLAGLSISQGTLSHHMRVLTEAGLVSCAKSGKWRHYTIETAQFDVLAGFFHSFTHHQTQSLACGCKK